MTRDHYHLTVQSALLHRFRVVACFGAFLYLAFGLLDRAVYPDLAETFFAIRLVAAAVLVAGYAASRTSWGARNVVWLTQIVLGTAGLGISAMVYVADGIESHYYQGLNLVMLAAFTINRNFVGHNVGAGLVVLAGYFAAVLLHRVAPAPVKLVEPLFFMGSTLTFVALMTKLFADQEKKLRESEMLKDQLFANVSHELRTPLALILGPVRKHLRAGNLGVEEKRDLEVVEKNAALLLKHVNDLLDVARLEAGMMTSAFVRVDLAELVKRTASLFEVAARERGLRLEVDAGAEGAVWAEVDDAKVERALFNLLSNAFKFAAEPGRVAVRLVVLGHDVALVVEDDGPGVPKELRSAIFERFRQGDGGVTRTHGGTGLGLAIASEFAALHGGRVEVGESELGGARFTLTLSRAARAGVRVGAAVASGAPALVGTPSFPAPSAVVSVAPTSPDDAPHILVVEDNPEMRRFVAEALASTFRVSTAGDGAEGLSVARQDPPDVIVTDMMMPGMSGEELVAALQADVALAMVPVMMLTAKADDALRVRMLGHGAHDYLCKPFGVEELRARVANLAAMKQLRDFLEGELAQKGESLVELARDLAGAKRRAEEASRLKDEFLMNLSHELRTPLTSIVGWSDLLKAEGVAEPELRDGLVVIDRNARALARLVNDLLDLSRVIRGKLRLEPRPVVLADIVLGVARSLAVAASAKQIGLVTDGVHAGAALPCDPERIQQVVWNLLTNALKFTPDGGRVEVVLTQDAGEARIVVRDNGEGIAPEFLPHVFERLRQGDSSTSKMHAGLGIGLAIARHLVELHGGRIECASEGVGKGACFTVILPARGSGAVRPPVEAPALRRVSGKLNGVRCVVVDDEPDSLRLIASILRPHGVEVVAAGSAVAAIAEIEKQTPDAVISDIGMPEHDGLWLLDRVKELSAALPFIAVSAYAEEAMQKKAYASGVRRYLPKPIEAGKLVATLEEIFAHR